MSLRWQSIVLMLWVGGAWAQGTDPGERPPELEATAADPGFLAVVNPAFPGPPAAPPVVDRGPALERADLAPYFQEGKAAKARQAFDQGAFTRTRELLDDVPDSTPVRYLRALAAWRGQDHAFAASEFERLADDYVPLRDRCLVHSGWSYEVLKDWEAAARVFSRVSEKSRVSADAVMGLARARRNLKDPTGAVAALAELVKRPAPPWGRDVGAEGLLVLADTAAWRGDKKAERAALIELWSKHPLASQARNAETRLGEVGSLPRAAIVARAELLIDGHRNARGLAYLEPLLEGLKLPDPVACQAHHAAGKALRKLRRHAQAATVLAPVVKRCADPELRARALYTLGFSQTIAAPLVATETYEALAREYPGHAYADDALFYAAEGYERRGELSKAQARLWQVVDDYPDGDFAADALFKLFWITRASAPAEAIAYLEEIEGRFGASDDSYELERARYWRARTLVEAGRKDEAAALWSTITREHPTTYYGLISRERVAEADEKTGLSLWEAIAPARLPDDPFPMYPGNFGSDPQLLSAIELLRLGFGELVPVEVWAINRARLPVEATRLLVHLLALAGEARPAHGMARLFLRRDLSGPITRQNRATWEVAYPKSYRTLVEERADEAGRLDPDLLQALMREESALDPKALSWAGALGLCQLMPATAAEVAMKLKLQPPSASDLFEPDLNIRLGARYLSDLVVRAKGVKQYALAGYNAGEGSVGRWKAENPSAPLDEWVENIPLQETRGYVKRVLRSYNTYRLLYAPTEAPKTVAPLPKLPPRASSPTAPLGKT